ncbi:hypothetical protein G6F37_007239 [Rhizopus arrhizus]|nr:hypothetical protein G6F38_004964 [Rhizopus arrhizus]KAG1156843.1 hypothetical protein G6F37_007239 [Rhizopus arrhizus]
MNSRQLHAHSQIGPVSKQYNTIPLNYSPPVSPSSSTVSHSSFSHEPSMNDSIDNCLVTHHTSHTMSPSFTVNKINQSYNNYPFDIRVNGISPTGARSRVETQIKLSIQLVPKDDTPCNWSYLRVPKHLLAKPKSKKATQKQQKFIDLHDGSKILDLEAKVICESNTNKKIKMCQGCRKRAERKKNATLTSIRIQPGSTVVDEAYEHDRQRILLFNCDPILDFRSNDTILPTRITCYCRHHDERIGFRVCFSLKDNQGRVIAIGQTPPIMITDDHKTSKTASPSRRHRRVRSRRTYCSSEDDMITPGSSRRNSAMVDVNKPSLSHIPTTSMMRSSVNDTINTLNSTPTLYSDPWKNTINSSDVYTSDPHSCTLTTHAALSPTNIFTEPHSTTTLVENSGREYESDDIMLLSTNSSASIFDNTCQSSQDEQRDFYSLPPPSTSTHYNNSNIAYLKEIIPYRGSLMGGTEVILVGNAFNRDMSVMFGDTPAVMLNVTPTYIVCLAPPSEQVCAVNVSFKNHSFVTTMRDASIFYYQNHCEQALCDLVRKMTQTPVHLANARQILSQYCTSKELLQTNECGHTLLHMASHMNNYPLACWLLSECAQLANSQDRNGLSPLHFAIWSRSTHIIQELLNHGANVYLPSCFGTPLDFVISIVQRQYPSTTRLTPQLIDTYLPWLPKSFALFFAEHYLVENGSFLPTEDNPVYSPSGIIH